MNAIQTIVRAISKNSPAILTALGVAGVLSTAILTSKATVEAVDRVRTMEERHGAAEDPKVRLEERVKLTWKLYIPSVLMGAATVACIIGAHSVHMRRSSALMSMYTLTETALKEYKEKVVETLGENKERKIREAIDQDHVNNAPTPSKEILLVNDGEVLCYDTMSDRIFKSDMETLRRAQNDINSDIIDHMYASLNDFYRRVGLRSTALGDEVGWNTERKLDIEFDTMLYEDKRPCMVLNYRVLPFNNYDRLH